MKDATSIGNDVFGVLVILLTEDGAETYVAGVRLDREGLVKIRTTGVRSARCLLLSGLGRLFRIPFPLVSNVLLFLS